MGGGGSRDRMGFFWWIDMDEDDNDRQQWQWWWWWFHFQKNAVVKKVFCVQDMAHLCGIKWFGICAPAKLHVRVTLPNDVQVHQITPLDDLQVEKGNMHTYFIQKQEVFQNNKAKHGIYWNPNSPEKAKLTLSFPLETNFLDQEIQNWWSLTHTSRSRVATPAFDGVGDGDGWADKKKECRNTALHDLEQFMFHRAKQKNYLLPYHLIRVVGWVSEQIVATKCFFPLVLCTNDNW